MSEIFTLDKLYNAYNECKKGKKNTHNALSFEMNRERNLLKLLHDLQTRQYKISRSIYFITVYPTAREIFAADFRDRIVHHLLYREIYDIFDSGNNGLPIGNLTSQFFSNIYLNELDYFIVKKLGFKHYVRYVDDFVIVDVSQLKLRSLILVIDKFLQKKLGLQLHPRKIIFQETRKGVDFLGYFVKPSHILVRQKVVRRFKDRLYQNIDREGFLPISDIPMIQSYLGHFSHANSWNLRRHLVGDNYT